MSKGIERKILTVVEEGKAQVHYNTRLLMKKVDGIGATGGEIPEPEDGDEQNTVPFDIHREDRLDNADAFRNAVCIVFDHFQKLTCRYGIY